MDSFDLRTWDLFSSAGGLLNEPTLIDQVVIDSRRIDSKHSLFVALKGKKEDGHRFIEHAAKNGAKFAIVSHDFQESPQGISLLKVANPLSALQSLAGAYRKILPTKILGMTGSFGKTMVKDLLYSLLSTEKKVNASPESFNSQIGVALSLLNFRKEDEIGIIEAAISLPNEMRPLLEMIQPDFSLLTPVGNKHHTTLDIQSLKKELWMLLEGTRKTGWALLPKDNQLGQLECPTFFWDTPSNTLPHAIADSASPFSKYQVIFPDHSIFYGQIKKGHAYFFNLVNMAVKAAWLFGISSSNIKDVLKEFYPEPMRTEIWKSTVGTLFINDTYCSDPQSIDHALNHMNLGSVQGRKYFVFEGMRGKEKKEIEYRRIGKALASSNIHNLLLVGNSSFQPVIDEMKKKDSLAKIIVFDDLHESFNFLKNEIKNEDLVLFKGKRKHSLEELTETFNDSINNNQCLINLAAIQANLSWIRKRLTEQTRIMVMVKALAYGTDDIRISKFLNNVDIDILGVSYIDEGITLKRSGVKQAIFSINAAPYEASKVVKWGIEVGVSDQHLIDLLAKEGEKQNCKVKVHLHINTGMGRFGCPPEDALHLARLIQSHPFLEFEGVMTHFACAEDPKEDDFTLAQVERFDQAVSQLHQDGIHPKWVHAANSAGALRFHLPQYNMVRLGLAVYGLYASEGTKKGNDLRLAISLVSRIVGINLCKKGDSISYGRKYTVQKESQKIAVLPIGYYDGLHRHYSGKGSVMIRGQKAPMIGNICMDNMMVDVTHIPDVEIGDKVLIFGEDEYGYYLSPEELAASGQSIAHELMTCLGPRIPRIFIFEEGKQIR